MRGAIINVLLFVLPFVAYALWVLATQRRLPTRVDWTLRVIGTLAGIGAVIMIVGLVFIIDWSGDDAERDGVYRPAELRDGVIIPAGVVEDDEAE